MLKWKIEKCLLLVNILSYKMFQKMSSNMQMNEPEMHNHCY